MSKLGVPYYMRKTIINIIVLSTPIFVNTISVALPNKKFANNFKFFLRTKSLS